jgi:hypothetical protein
MYPPTICPGCLRGDLFIVYDMMIEYRKKHSREIEKDNRFKSMGDTIDFPLGDLFDKFLLKQCCRIELMTKDDCIHNIYGSYDIDQVTS